MSDEFEGPGHDDVFEDADGVHYGLVMPFVVCASQGGPYDDEAFVAGWELGRLDVMLERMTESVDFTCCVRASGQIRTASVPQADLIAMRHGWQLTATEVDPGVGSGWSIIELTREA